MSFKNQLRFSVCALALPLALAATSASAAGIVSGSVGGPDSGFAIALSFSNALTSTLNVTSLTLDGSSAILPDLIWGDIVSFTAPAGATVSNSAVGFSLLTFTFGGDGWNPGEGFGLSLDPDTVSDPSFGATVSNLTKTRVTFNFSDASSQIFEFIDAPAPDAGLVLSRYVAAVPEPATWLSMVFGFGMLGAAIRRRRAVKVAYS